MAKNESKEDKKGLLPIEELAESSGVKPEVFAGLKIHCGWGAGKTLLKEEFEKALKGFLSAPADGRKKKEQDKKEVSRG